MKIVVDVDPINVFEQIQDGLTIGDIIKKYETWEILENFSNQALIEYLSTFGYIIKSIEDEQ